VTDDRTGGKDRSHFRCRIQLPSKGMPVAKLGDHNGTPELAEWHSGGVRSSV
jgi:hypothetical protein